MPNGIGEREQLAFAKLTVHLHLTGVREDGYHLIDSEMVSLDLADTLTFDDGDSLTITGLGADAIESDPSNLVVKALSAANKTAAVALHKNIPAGGGLGGGSSDAAAAFRWAGVLDTDIAAKIGADVPFCVRGGRASVRGIGEQLTPLSYVERTFTLITPPVHVNTASVFRAFDEDPSSDGQNHLEAAAIKVQPELASWRTKIGEWTGKQPVLAGSGATWFVEGAIDAPDEVELQGARWVVARTTPPLPL